MDGARLKKIMFESRGTSYTLCKNQFKNVILKYLEILKASIRIN